MTQPNATIVSAPTASSGDAPFPGAWIGSQTLIYDSTMVPPAPDTGGKVYQTTFNDIDALAAMARSIPFAVHVVLVTELVIDTIEVDLGPEFTISSAEGSNAGVFCQNNGHFAATGGVKAVFVGVSLDGDGSQAYFSPAASSDLLAIELHDSGINDTVPLVGASGGSTAFVDAYGESYVGVDTLDGTGAAVFAQAFGQADFESQSGANVSITLQTDGAFIDPANFPITEVPLGFTLTNASSVASPDPNVLGIQGQSGARFVEQSTPTAPVYWTCGASNVWFVTPANAASGTGATNRYGNPGASFPMATTAVRMADGTNYPTTSDSAKATLTGATNWITICTFAPPASSGAVMSRKVFARNGTDVVACSVEFVYSVDGGGTIALTSYGGAASGTTVALAAFGITSNIGGVRGNALPVGMAFQALVSGADILVQIEGPAGYVANVIDQHQELT